MARNGKAFDAILLLVAVGATCMYALQVDKQCRNQPKNSYDLSKKYLLSKPKIRRTEKKGAGPFLWLELHKLAEMEFF